MVRLRISGVTYRARQTLLLAIVALMLVSERVDGQSVSEFRFEDGKLTIHARNLAVADVIDRVAQRAPLEVVGRDRLTGSVSVDFDDLPLVRGLDAILADFNFFVSIVESANGGPARYILHIHSRHRTTEAPPPTGPMFVPTLEAARAAARERESSERAANADPDSEPDADDAGDLAGREAAGEFRPTTSFEQLVPVLDDSNPLIRRRVLGELYARSAQKAVPRLIEALDDDSVDVREFAVETLGRMTDASSLTLLGEALSQQGDADVRVWVLMALALRADDPATSRVLQTVVNDPNPVIRRAASEMLAEIARRRP